MTHNREFVIGGIRKLRGKTFKALLGDGSSGGRVLVSGKANYVWIRPKYGSSIGVPVQALNRHVPPISGRLVRVREINVRGMKGYEVIDFDSGTHYYHDTTGQEPLAAHGWTHESGPGEGSDPTNLYTRGWAELRVEALDPAVMWCYVTYGWYLFDTPAWFDGGNTPIFTAPTLTRYDIVYINSSGTIGIEQGVEGAPAGAFIPEPPDYTIPLAVIQFTGTAGGITDDMILDSRVMPNVKEPILFDDSITPSAVTSGLGSWAGDDGYPARADHRHNLTEPLRLLDGVIGAPSYSFANEPTLGFYRRGVGEVGLGDSLWIGNDLYVVDHVRMATGTCIGNFNVGGHLRAGSGRVGDATNYANFAADGEQTLAGTARVYQGRWLNASGVQGHGANTPTLTDLGIGVVLRYSDAPANYECASAKMRVPGNIDSTIQPQILIGWSSATADPGDDTKQCRWEIAYLWRTEDEDMSAAADGTVTNNYSASTVANGLVITGVQLANMGAADACVTVRICRRSDVAGDTLGDNADLHGICLRYVANRLGAAT